jgi:hypothetical protein
VAPLHIIYLFKYRGSPCKVRQPPKARWRNLHDVRSGSRAKSISGPCCLPSLLEKCKRCMFAIRRILNCLWTTLTSSPLDYSHLKRLCTVLYGRNFISQTEKKSVTKSRCISHQKDCGRRNSIVTFDLQIGKGTTILMKNVYCIKKLGHFHKGFIF